MRIRCYLPGTGASRPRNFSVSRAIRLRGLSEAKKRALLLADNKIAESAGWDRERLAIELPELAELLIAESLDISITGFEPVEIDTLVSDFEESATDPADDIQADWLSLAPVSQPGDVWQLGPHRLLCGDARDPVNLDRLLGDEQAAMAFLDPPYNVKIASVVGRGRTKHSEFAMASGEMSRQEFVGFLSESLGNAATHSCAGAVHYVCIDWRHVGELREAGQQTYGEMLNLVVWVKSNAGQGSFYRSQHELIGVFRVGDAPHLNNVKLGRHGRSRSNVWRYPGVNSFRAGRIDELSAHPTPKPVALAADAMKDCTRRRDIVLDTFCGSGTTLMAAERVGRRAYCLELEPRWMRSTWRPAAPSMSVRSRASVRLKRQRVEEGAMARKSKIGKHGSGDGPETRDNAPASVPPAEEEYRVGPGRPPKEHRWKPGQSGNPKGAKRKKRSLIPELKEEFERVFSQKLKVTQGDRQRLITRWVAGLEQLSIQFAKGDRHARRDVFYFAEKLGVDLLTSAKSSDDTLSADRQAILEGYVERRMQEKATSASAPVLAPPELLDDAPDETDKN
jgi:DNA modification methylase